MSRSFISWLNFRLLSRLPCELLVCLPACLTTNYLPACVLHALPHCPGVPLFSLSNRQHGEPVRVRVWGQQNDSTAARLQVFHKESTTWSLLLLDGRHCTTKLIIENSISNWVIYEGPKRQTEPYIHVLGDHTVPKVWGLILPSQGQL